MRLYLLLFFFFTSQTLTSAEQRPVMVQVLDRIRILEKEFELIVRQFSRTVFGANVHTSQLNGVANHQPLNDRTGRSDPENPSFSLSLPAAIPGMSLLSQLGSDMQRSEPNTVNRQSDLISNPFQVLQELIMNIMMQFQAIIRTLTALPGSEILG